MVAEFDCQIARRQVGRLRRTHPSAVDLLSAFVATTRLGATSPIRYRCPSWQPLTESPFGTNMAYRREMFEKYGGFRSDLGPRPGRDIQHNEDTEFGNRLLAAGERLWYEPSAIVYHSVARDRLRKEYFLAWWFNKSRADVRAYGPPVVSKLRIGAIPVRLFRRLAVSMLRWIVAVGQSRRFSSKINVWCVAGQIVGCYREAQSNRPQENDVRNLQINGAEVSAQGHSKANH